MAETSIEWTATRLADGTVLPGYTFNAWTGCTKVSPGCDHCYAEGWSKRSGHVEWGPHGARRRTTATYWKQPLKWNAEAENSGIRRKVFCSSLADVFDNHASILPDWKTDLWQLIRQTPHLDWLLLTKRPQNIGRFMPNYLHSDRRWPNVWLGITVENQTEADRRIPLLLAEPAAVRFLSIEPLLGPVDIERVYMDVVDCAFGETGAMHGLDWVIVGGESGPGARPMHPDWVRSLQTQCQAARVPFFFKQWGEFAPIDGPENVARGDELRFDIGMIRTGKKRAGRLLNCREWNEMPEVSA